MHNLQLGNTRLNQEQRAISFSAIIKFNLLYETIELVIEYLATRLVAHFRPAQML